MKRRSQGLRKLHSLWILMGPLRLCSFLAIEFVSDHAFGFVSRCTSRLVGIPRAGGTQADKTSRGVVADPPVRTRPPATLSEVSNPKADWTECLIKNPVVTADQNALRIETWVFRTADFGDFQRHLKIRGFENAGETASLSCRERQVDPEVRCSECVRLLRGGYYGHLGVCVPAYPPRQDAIGCLALSRTIDMPAPATEEDDSGDWDGDQGRQTAFCNSVNVRFDKVSS
ncbi:Smyd3 [Symbiodinium sp. CCMP2592]|nr:Smyd3 [Symbiodinium sp. CCMP2592]